MKTRTIRPRNLVTPKERQIIAEQRAGKRCVDCTIVFGGDELPHPLNRRYCHDCFARRITGRVVICDVIGAAGYWVTTGVHYANSND